METTEFSVTVLSSKVSQSVTHEMQGIYSDKMQSLLEVSKTFKFAAVLVRHSHQSSLGLEYVVT